MRKFIFLLLFSGNLVLHSKAQDTIFYSEPCIETTGLESCNYFEIYTIDKKDKARKNISAFYKSGQLKLSYQEQKDKDTRITTEYYESGKVHYEIEYKKEQIKSFRSYWKLGKPKRIEQYVQGKLVDSACFDLMGKNIPFFKFEQEAEYPGGEDALNSFLSANIVYPPRAQSKNIQGRVIINFVISEEGKILNPRVMKGVCPEIDTEAMRVIRLMPLWKPARQDGEKCNQSFSLPIVFQI